MFLKEQSSGRSNTSYQILNHLYRHLDPLTLNSPVCQLVRRIILSILHNSKSLLQAAVRFGLPLLKLGREQSFFFSTTEFFGSRWS